MLFKRSTRSLVTGKRPRSPKDDPGQQPDIAVVSSLEGQEEPQKPNYISEVNTFMAKLNLPRWAYWAAAAAVMVLLIVIIVLAVAPKSSTSPAEAPALPEIGADQTVISVQADAALTALVEPGDIVQLYAADGAVVEELQYLQVYKPAEEGCLLLLVNSKQAAAIVSREISTSVVLVSHNDAERAGELLALQARINNPKITLELQPTAVIAPGVPTDLTYLAEIDPIEAVLPDLQWSSSDTTTVAVKNGTVYGVKVGEATVTVKCGSLEASCVVTVEIPLNEIQLNREQTVMAVGETLKLSARPEPENATHFDVTWSVSDPAVATVSEDGTVTAVAPGSVVVTATSGGVSAQCTIQVGYHAEVVQLNLQTISLAIGQQHKLAPSVYPTNDLIDVLEYSSSNAAVATVADDGTVTAVAAGTATITLRCGEIAVKCTVTVTQ